MDKKQIEILIEKINAASDILIFGHKNPDGDSLGGALGLAHLIVDNFGKNVVVAYDGNLPFKYDFIPGRRDMVYVEKLGEKKYDLVISVDTPVVRMMGDGLGDIFKNARDTIKIDHHKTGADDAHAALSIVQDDFTSASEIIFDIANMAKWRIGPDAANCLYIGIYSDTGGFNYMDNGMALRAAADLIDSGADARNVLPNLNMLSREDILAEATALAAAEFFLDGKLAVVSIPNKLYKKLDSGETTVLMRIRSVRGVVAAVFLKEAKPKTTYVSMRSDMVAVRPIAEKLGGGGHDFAAAVNMDVEINTAKQIVVNEFAGIL